jgi:hypothetical protein
MGMEARIEGLTESLAMRHENEAKIGVLVLVFAISLTTRGACCPNVQVFVIVEVSGLDEMKRLRR